MLLFNKTSAESQLAYALLLYNREDPHSRYTFTLDRVRSRSGGIHAYTFTADYQKNSRTKVYTNLEELLKKFQEDYSWTVSTDSYNLQIYYFNIDDLAFDQETSQASILISECALFKDIPLNKENLEAVLHP